MSDINATKEAESSIIENTIIEEELIQSPGRTALNNFLAKKTAIAGVVMFSLIFLLCFILPVFFPLDVNFADSSQQHIRPGLNLMRVPGNLKNNAKIIDVGNSFGAGVDFDNNVYIWGNPTNERLLDIPQNMGNIIMLSVGLDHILVLNDQGNVFTWGNDRHRLSPVPTEVRMSNIVFVEAGNQISIAVDDTGEIHVWGNRGFVDVIPELFEGQVREVLLMDATAFVISYEKNLYALTSREILIATALPQSIQGRVEAVAATNRDVLALLTDGTVVSWGNREYGVDNIPPEIQGRVKSISAGSWHFSASLDDDTVVTWGRNNYRQINTPNLSNIVSVHSGYYQNYAVDTAGTVHSWGFSGYLMGTDHYGRNVFRRTLEGGKISLTIGAIGVLIASFIGILVGGISGYFLGKVDLVLMRFAEIVNSIPFLPLAIVLSYAIGHALPEHQRLVLIMFIWGLLNWSFLARLTRANILDEREKDFVTAAKAMGVREGVIIFKHILPNILPIILVQILLSLATIMIFEASLSFLGLGITEPGASWGNMLQGLRSTDIRYNWWRWVFPALTLSFAVISISMIGDALRDAIDPKSNDR